MTQVAAENPRTKVGKAHQVRDDEYNKNKNGEK